MAACRLATVTRARRHRRGIADRIRGGLRATQATTGASREIAAALQQLREALPGHRDVHVHGGRARADLDAADLIGPPDQAFAQRESDGVVLEVGRGRKHHHVRHVVVDERDRRLFGDEVGRCAVAPRDQRSTTTWATEAAADVGRESALTVTAAAAQAAQAGARCLALVRPDVAASALRPRASARRPSG